MDKLIYKAMKPEMTPIKKVKSELINISDLFADVEWGHFGRKADLQAMCFAIYTSFSLSGRLVKQFFHVA